MMKWLNNLRPAMPMSAENPCKNTSNGEIKRLVNCGGILVNGEK